MAGDLVPVTAAVPRPKGLYQLQGAACGGGCHDDMGVGALVGKRAHATTHLLATARGQRAARKELVITPILDACI